MTDKVQKIREEVVRMHNLLPVMDGDNIYVNYADRICTTLEMYIDYLEEEPIFHVGDTIRHKEENDSFKILAIEDDFYKLENNIVVSIAAQDSWELVEEPVSNVWHYMSEEPENGKNIIIIDPKDFYGAVLRKGGSTLRNNNKKRYVKWAYIDDIINIVKKEEPVSEDLGNYINELSKQFPEVSFAKLSRIAVRVVKWKEKEMQSTIELAEDHAMLAGMEKMKEQMLAKASMSCVLEWYDGFVLNFTEEQLNDVVTKNNINIGDKVKVIVIKED